MAFAIAACSGGNSSEIGRELGSAARDAAADSALERDADEPDAAALDAATAVDTAVETAEEDATLSAPDAAVPDGSAPDASPPDAAVPTLAFSLDLESALPSNVDPGSGTLSPSEGAATLGPVGNQFGATLLRSATGNVVTVTLANLPAHSSITLDFLFAAIDSLDGAGTFPAGDYFRIDLDGNTIFRESFANALPDQVQTYDPPAGVTLARHVDLGFAANGGYYTDSAYDMGADPQFDNIAHTAANAVLTFTLEGQGVQTLDDESWAIDNVRVTVNP